MIDAVKAIVGSVPAFDCRFSRTEWFDTNLLWLAPEPSDPFAELTAAVSRAFPGYPPYQGAYDEVVPHLTVGYDAELSALRDAERAVSAGLPLTARIDRVLLIAGAHAPRSWRVLAEFPLG